MRHTRLRAYGMGLTIAAVGLLAACQGKKTAPPEAVSSMDLEPAQVIGLGRIEPELRILDLQSEVSGLAAKVLVRAGDKVTKSQVLVELSSAIERAKLELKAAQVRAERSQIEAARAAWGARRLKAENPPSRAPRRKRPSMRRRPITNPFSRRSSGWTPARPQRRTC
jgi:multidrug efflux pump subunit AcrA (membrane-fusion protein)